MGEVTKFLQKCIWCFAQHHSCANVAAVNVCKGHNWKCVCPVVWVLRRSKDGSLHQWFHRCLPPRLDYQVVEVSGTLYFRCLRNVPVEFTLLETMNAILGTPLERGRFHLPCAEDLGTKRADEDVGLATGVWAFLGENWPPLEMKPRDSDLFGNRARAYKHRKCSLPRSLLGSHQSYINLWPGATAYRRGYPKTTSRWPEVNQGQR